MEQKFNKESLRKAVKNKRLLVDEVGMDKACKEIGISKATLSRLENGSVVDLETFVKIINWLGHNPNVYINEQNKTN